ncbi:MAG: PKD domain-containing protein [Candidatus Micrarchaeota archaeon]|nr:PKD domain-containing protein [Candidatus Micrarchaeota archaeon]
MKKEIMIFALAAMALAGIAQANVAPTITSVSGATSLLVNTEGTWQISAYDPDAAYLTYSVSWGDGSVSPSSASAGPFRHTYALPANYTAMFTVTDDQGASTQSQVLVQAYKIAVPDCPGFTRLVPGDSISDGKYSIELVSVQGPNPFAIEESATFALKDGQAEISHQSIGKAAAFRSTMPNGDQIEVGLCDVASDPSPSYQGLDDAYLKLFVNGKAATYGYQPSVEDTCQNDSQFTLIHVGNVVGNSYLQARLSDISVASGSKNTHPAILDILSASDNFTVQIMQVTIAPFYLERYTLPWGKKLFITACRVGSGFALNSKWVEIKVQDENGEVMRPPSQSPAISPPAQNTSPLPAQPAQNQPPVITSVSGSTSLEPNETGMWGISAYDSDGVLLNYSVQWGDGGSYQSGSIAFAQFGSVANILHAYSQAGNYTINFTVADSSGATAQMSANVTVGNACSDTDGGPDIYVKGTASGYEAGTLNYVVRTDYCKSPTEIVEYFREYSCTVNNRTWECPNGCYDGACNPPVPGGAAPSPAPPPPTVSKPAVPCDFCPSSCTRAPPVGDVCSPCRCPANLGFCDAAGLRQAINGTQAYCFSQLWLAQKGNNQTCQNSFECKSNFCSSGACYDIAYDVQKDKGTLQMIIDWLRNLFGFRA